MSDIEDSFDYVDGFNIEETFGQEEPRDISINLPQTTKNIESVSSTEKAKVELKKNELTIGNFSFPPGLFNKRLAILAMQGAGKSYTAGVLEEEMLDYINQPGLTNVKLIIIDPVGAHWGLRSHFPIHIFGGSHGDLPLDSKFGKSFANLSQTLDLSMVIDLSSLDQDGMLTFVTDFLNEIYILTSTTTHIILEEADLFAPQRAISKLQKFSSAAVDSIVRRGRGKGIGVTMITQRPAVLNKNVLTQVDASIIMNIVGETDLNTIREYFDSAGITKEDITKYIEKIIKFGKGSAFIFSPSWLKSVEEIKIRERVSFHSGAEPELGKENTFDEVKLVPVNTDLIINIISGNTQHDVLKEIVLRKEKRKFYWEQDKEEINKFLDTSTSKTESKKGDTIATIFVLSMLFIIFAGIFSIIF